MWMPEEDSVIREVPVVISKALSGQLYMMQFPRTPMSVPLMEDAFVRQAQIKPNQDLLQLKLELDTEVRYCKKTGESLQAATTGGVAGQHDDQASTLLEERILESASIPRSSKSQRYVIGVIRNGQLHLSPLKSIIQMHNKLTYLNSADKAASQINKENEEEEESDPETTKVTVKFKQTRDLGATKLKNPKSYKALMKKHDEEPWTELSYSNYIESPEEFEKLCSGSKESETPFYVVDHNNYLDSLLPKQTEVVSEGTAKKAERELLIRSTYEQLKSLTLPEQLKAIMLKGKLMHHSHIHEFLKLKLKIVSVDEQSLMRSMQTVAVLVQGCWAVKSDLLYPVGFVSEYNGISGPVMQKGRDLILSHFDEGNRVVCRTEMCKLTRLPNDEVTEILKHLCHLNRKEGWEFSLMFDSTFIKQNPEVVERQSMLWQAKRNRISQSMQIDEQGVPRRRKSRNSKSISDNDSGKE